jgi:hypothetical protein
MKIQETQAREQLLVLRNKAQYDAWSAARNTQDKSVQWTRRIIALSAVLAIVVWPKFVVVFWPDITVTVGWTEWKSGFLFFTSGRNIIEWHTASGLVLTPLDTNLVSAIAGMYFGGSLASRKGG